MHEWSEPASTSLSSALKSFAETFRDLRTRRRIPMRLFQERVGASTSYIHDLEKNDVLPGLDRARELAEVFRDVATEQGAADPEDDARQLLQARERTLLTKRLGIPPLLAEALIKIREPDADLGTEFALPLLALARLEKEQRLALAEPMQNAIRLFELLEPDQRSGLARTIKKTTHVVEAVQDIEERRAVIMKLVDNLDDILKEVEARDPSVTGADDHFEIPETRPA